MASEDRPKDHTASATAATGLAGRYATAAFELALDEHGLEALASDLAGLRKLLDENVDLNRLVRSPVITRDEKARAMEAVLAAANASQLARRLVLLLVEKRRLFALKDVIDDFEQLLARHKGEISAEVTSARALKDDEAQELRRILKDKLGREPRLRTHVDPTLLGGLIVRIGSRMIDSSLRTKLSALRIAMKGT